MSKNLPIFAQRHAMQLKHIWITVGKFLVGEPDLDLVVSNGYYPLRWNLASWKPVYIHFPLTRLFLQLKSFQWLETRSNSHQWTLSKTILAIESLWRRCWSNSLHCFRFLSYHSIVSRFLTGGFGFRKHTQKSFKYLTTKTVSTTETSQELRMLSTVTLNCQVTKIVMNSGSQLSELQPVSQLL